MARRMIDSSIWSNEKFATLAPRGRLLQIGMIDIADDQGRLKAHPIYLAKEIFPYDHIEPADITKWLAQMEENGTIVVYMVDGKQYAQFLNWWQYQALQFAHPSAYPRPDGWQDRLRFNSKGNQMLVSNWTTPKGERMVDTCDQDGCALRFLMELPVKNKAAEAPAQVATQVRTLVAAEASTEVATQAPTQVPALVRTQVTKLPTTNYQPNLTEPNNNNSALHTLALSEAEKAVVVVGVPSLLLEFDHGQKMALLTWLWLFNGWYEDELRYRDLFRRSYKSDPFAGMKQPGAVMVVKARERTMAPLHPDDRAEMDAKLAEVAATP